MSVCVQRNRVPKAFQSFIQEICFYQLEAGEVLHFLPDGCVEIIFQLDTLSQQKLEGQEEWHTRPQVFVGGLHNQSYYVRQQKGSRGSIGIKLLPQVAAQVLSEKVSVFKNQIINAEDVFSADLETLNEQLLNAEERAKQLDILLSSLFGRIEPKHYSFRDLGLNLMISRQGRIAVADLAKNAHTSLSNFRKIFRENIGLAPSEYLKLIRIRKVVNDLIFSSQSIKDIAYDNGYYDLSHFNREFKSILHCAPRDFQPQEYHQK